MKQKLNNCRYTWNMSHCSIIALWVFLPHCYYFLGYVAISECSKLVTVKQEKWNSILKIKTFFYFKQ